MIDRLVIQIATLGPLGKRLPAPGTFGTLAGILTVACLVGVFEIHIWIIALGFTPLFLLGIPICTKAEKILGKNDPGCVIWDEFCVIPYLFIFIPDAVGKSSSSDFFLWNLIAFATFRFFDVLKPLGIKKLQNIPRGAGVMLDDLAAAFISAIVLLLIKTFPLSFQ